jgi:hypothetical protein
MEAIGKVLFARQLSVPDGRPLYAYRIASDEFEDLHTSLRRKLTEHQQLDHPSAAAFCLVAAEYLSRGDGSDWWTWGSVKTFVGFDGADADVRDAVRRGLAYWKRPLVIGGTGRQFLGTLVCEGGLPLKLVQDEGARLRRFFRELLREHETYPTMDPVELATRLGLRLPARMQNAIVYELAAQLVRQVAEMRLRKVSAEDAIAWPVPLRLDADVARELLEGLRTAPILSRKGEVGIVVQTVVRLGNEQLIQREIVLPPRVSARWFEEKLGTKQLPIRLDLSVQAADGPRVRVGIAALQGDGYFVRSVARTVARPESVAGQLLCIGSFGGKDLGSFVPMGGTALAPTPWIFSDDGTEGTLLSACSYRSRANSLLVAIPEEGDSDGSVDELGQVLGHRRRLVRLRGEFLWIDGDDEVLVTTGQSEDRNVDFELHGRRPPAFIHEADLWLGCPEVVEVPADGGAIRRLGSADLKWRSRAPGSSWRKLDVTTLGPGQLAVGQGHAGFRAFVRILPGDLRVNLRCGRNGDGVVELRSVALIAVGVAAVPCLRALVRSVAGGFDVHLSAEAPSVPASVVVQLRFLGGAELPIRLPFPAECAAFIGRDGKALLHGASLSVDELAQLRAVVVTPERLAWSVDVRAGRGSEHLAYLRTVADGVQQLHLEPLRDSLATVLASHAGLDDEVELRLVREGVIDGGEPRLLVRRYDLALRSRNEGDVHRIEIVRQDAEKLPPATLAALRAEAVPMDAPDRVTVLLERQEPGVWSTDHPSLSPGAWLVLVLQGSYLRGRPFRITIPGSCVNAPGSELERAIAMGDRDARRERIADIFTGMAGDPLSPERDVVRSQLRMVGRCPASTFDVIHGLISEPVLAVQFLLEAGQRQSIVWDGLTELPFDWACIPVRLWLKAIRVYVHHLRQCLPDPCLLGSVLKSAAPGVFGKVKLAAFLSCVHEAAFLTIDGVPTPDDHSLSAMAQHQIPVPFLLQFDENRQALLQRHADDTWWPLAPPFGDDVVDACRWELAPLIARFRENPGFREPVLLTPMVLAMQVLGDAPSCDLLRLRRIRAFDSDWFDFAYAYALSFLLGRRYAKKEDPFHA